MKPHGLGFRSPAHSGHPLIFAPYNVKRPLGSQMLNMANASVERADQDHCVDHADVARLRFGTS